MWSLQSILCCFLMHLIELAKLKLSVHASVTCSSPNLCSYPLWERAWKRWHEAKNHNRYLTGVLCTVRRHQKITLHGTSIFCVSLWMSRPRWAEWAACKHPQKFIPGCVNQQAGTPWGKELTTDGTNSSFVGTAPSSAPDLVLTTPLLNTWHLTHPARTQCMRLPFTDFFLMFTL